MARNPAVLEVLGSTAYVLAVIRSMNCMHCTLLIFGKRLDLLEVVQPNGVVSSCTADADINMVPRILAARHRSFGFYLVSQCLVAAVRSVGDETQTKSKASILRLWSTMEFEFYDNPAVTFGTCPSILPLVINRYHAYR